MSIFYYGESEIDDGSGARTYTHEGDNELNIKLMRPPKEYEKPWFWMDKFKKYIPRMGAMGARMGRLEEYRRRLNKRNRDLEEENRNLKEEVERLKVTIKTQYDENVELEAERQSLWNEVHKEEIAHDKRTRAEMEAEIERMIRKGNERSTKDKALIIE